MVQLLQAQTSVTLAATPNPAAFGAPITLTATVTTAAANPVAITGRVTFYDGVAVLGTRPLAAGTASLTTIALPSGSRKLRAYYAGDAVHPAAASNVVTQTVNAQPSASFAGTALPSDIFRPLAVADFNNDGKADIAALDPNGIAVLLGDGAGNFTPARTPIGNNPYTGPAAVAVDFNGDGNIDLAVHGSYTGVGILLGKGDGTFQPPVNIPFSGPGLTLSLGDINGDGIVDLIASNSTGVDPLLGIGDGTFATSGAFAAPADYVVVGDFNGDGKADLAVAGGTTLSILRGKGDGTFQSSVPLGLPAPVTGLATGDFNGDSKADLATANGNVLLGNGDGTFQPLVTYPSGSNGSVTAGDFNGDGFADLLLGGDVLTLLYGKGDGTFQPPFAIPFASGSATILTGDFNGDGRIDLAYDRTILLGTTVTVIPTGTPQSTPIGTAFSVPLKVTVKDGANPLSGVTVTFSVGFVIGLQSAVLSSPTAVTDANGMASVMATANATPGSYTVTATALGVRAAFSLTNLPGSASVLKITGFAAQQAMIDTAFSHPLQVALQDAAGNPVSGTTVTFTVPSSGASAILSAVTAVTDNTGIASVTARANHIAGSYTVTASAGSLSARFSLTNLQAATVSLASSANPAQFGAPLTLTATVSGGGSTGRVTFFDGVSILGIKPLAAGAASLSTSLLSAGSHKLTAYYFDSANNVAGTSNTIVETVRAVAGGLFAPQAPVAIPVSTTPNTLVIADFNGDGKPDLASPGQDAAPWWQVDLGASSPIGSITIWNRTDCCADRLADYWVFVSNTPFNPSDTPATLQIRAGTFASHQTTVPNPSVNIRVSGVSGRYVRVQLSNPGYLSLAEVQVFDPGDFVPPQNLALHKPATQSTTLSGAPTASAAAAVDGNTDGAFFHGSVTSTSLSAVAIALGKGDGTFQPPAIYGASSGVMASGDFNGDGNTDLALYDNSNVTVLLGNGDGTFRPGTTWLANAPLIPAPASRLSYSGIVVGDFNGDGKADIVTGLSEYCCGPLFGSWFALGTLLPGNGDGTFGSSVDYHGVPPPYVLADFNGDGKPDLAGAGFYTSALPVALGNGDGTARLIGETTLLGSMFFPDFRLTSLTGDFNVDGKPDLIIDNSVFTGKGDGTFQGAGTFPPPNSFSGRAAATGDFNGDGILDLVVVDTTGLLTGILYGNGDGTFRQGLVQEGGNVLAVADFNGDGRADILTGTSAGAVVLLSTSAASITLTASGGTPQSAALGAPFASPLQVTVKDGSGNPVGGIVVSFAAPTVGPTAALSSPTGVTNAAGIASVTATANNLPGTYSVTARVGASSTSFSLTNTPAGTNNLAQGKTATQSSTYTGNLTTSAAAAVDGNTNGNYSLGSVTATNNDPYSWWQVDLGTPATINLSSSGTVPIAAASA